jgi:hypothetical protein
MVTTLDRRKAYELAQAVERARQAKARLEANRVLRGDLLSPASAGAELNARAGNVAQKGDLLWPARAGEVLGGQTGTEINRAVKGDLLSQARTGADFKDPPASSRPGEISSKIGNYLSGRSPELLAAQARAVSRGPGVLAGSVPGLSTPQAANRTATSLGLAMADMFGNDPRSAAATMQQMAKTVAGETSGLPAAEQAAAARTMFNRMAVALAGIANDKQYTTDPLQMLRAYDANGMRHPSKRNPAYVTARPGTADYARGLAAIASGASPYGNLMSAPAAIQDSTHYLNKESTLESEGKLPPWASGANNEFGPHSFGTPDISASRVRYARRKAHGMP